MIEGKSLDHRTVLLRKQDRHVKKMFKGNRSLKDTVKDFFERPISFTKGPEKEFKIRRKRTE
jgi:hypothetical protein